MLRNLSDVAARNFVWKPGKWKLTLRYQLLGKETSDDYAFSVSPDDIQRLKALFDSYNAGYGVFANWRFFTPDGSQPMRQVSIAKVLGAND